MQCFANWTRAPQTGGIDEIDLAQVQNQRLGSAGEVVVDEREKLLLGVRIQLPGETEQKTSVLLFKTTAERDGQSLQILLPTSLAIAV